MRKTVEYKRYVEVDLVKAEGDSRDPCYGCAFRVAADACEAKPAFSKHCNNGANKGELKKGQSPMIWRAVL